MKIRAEMGHWSSVVGGGVHLIGEDGRMVGQIMFCCHTDDLRDKDVQMRLARICCDAINARATAATAEQALAADILAELIRARAKFPGKNVTFAALVEEVGELATATFEESSDRVRKEAVQVAVMAMRMVLDGDHCFDSWRAEKGLDHLDPARRVSSEEA